MRRATESTTPPRKREVEVETVAHPYAGRADRVRADEVVADQPDHPEHAPDAEDEQGQPDRRPSVDDEVDDDELDRREHGEDHEDRERLPVVAESLGAAGHSRAACDGSGGARVEQELDLQGAPQDRDRARERTGAFCGTV
jgi:archaellum component FlaD/FlaE